MDTSLTKHSKIVQDGIEANGLQLTDIALIIITHTHYDHCQGLFELKKKLTKAKVLVHRNETENLSKGTFDMPSGAYRIMGPLTSAATLINNLTGMLNYPPVDADINMDFTEYPLNEFFPGRNYYILLTPGHSNGSLSVILDKEAIVGDLMGNSPLNRRTTHLALFNDNIDDVYDYWAILLNLDLERFYPGHGDGFIDREAIRQELEDKKLVNQGGAGCMV